MLLCSVVVPTRARPAELETCLASLATQTLDPNVYEIIVVDDASLMETLEQVVRWSALSEARVRYVPVEGRVHGAAAARNAGWRVAVARGELVAFTDDNAVPPRDWLETGLGVFRDPGFDAAWGGVVAAPPPRPGLATANWFVKRSVLTTIGGFDDAFCESWREDGDLYFRLMSAGYRIAHLDRASVFRPIRPTALRECVRAERAVEDDALLYKKHPALYATHARPSRPLIYYPIVAALCAMLAGAAARSPNVTLGGAVVWLSLTLWLAVRRLHGVAWAPAQVAEEVLAAAVIPAVSLYWKARGRVKHRVFW
jgi:GT2 family glycosyltransferase